MDNYDMLNSNDILKNETNRNQSIVIQSPYITKSQDLCRLNATLVENGQKHNLYVEVEKEYGEFLCTERGDAFVYLALPVALREGYNIYSEAPVTEQFLHNINEILIPHLALGDPQIHPIRVYASTENTLIGGGNIGTAISCGVDSLYTVMEYSKGKYPGMDLTHLFIASANAELWETRNADLHKWESEHKIQFDRYNIVSEMLNLPIVKAYTNFFWYVCGGRDWKTYHHLFTHNYITMATVLALKKMWKIYYFSSTFDFTHFTLKDNHKVDTADYELLSMHILSVPDFSCYSGGAKTNRVIKTKSLADYPIAQKTLHPCHESGIKNCSKPTCSKCLRALLTYDYYDKLESMSEVFDIEFYKKNHSKYLWHLVAKYNHINDKPFLEEIYAMMCEKYPNDMEKAVNRWRHDTAPTVPRSEYNALKGNYDLLLELLQLEKPSEFALYFFSSHNIQTLYHAGWSLIGNRILTLISKDINCVTYKDSNALKCDAVFILDTIDTEINKKIEIFKSRGIDTNRIYTLHDFEKELKAYISRQA